MAEASAPKHSWLKSLAVYCEQRTLVMLALGFASGLPFWLIFDDRNKGEPPIQYPNVPWEEPAKYAGAKQIFKGELGRLYGARYVEHTNPWIEGGAAGAENTYAAAGNIFGVVTLGDEALGAVDLSGGNSPYKPSMTILDKADKSEKTESAPKSEAAPAPSPAKSET